MKRLCLVFFSFMFSACTSTKVQQNSLDCGVWVFGIPQASRYDKAYFDQETVEFNARTVNRCMREHYADGFHSSTSAVIADAALKPNFPVFFAPGEEQRSLITSDQGVQLLPGQAWERASPPTALYQFFMKNRQRNAALAISVFEQNPLIVWSDTRDALYRRNFDELENYNADRFREVRIKGNDVAILKYSGTHKISRAPLRFLAAHYRWGRKNIYLTLWCFEFDYEKNQKEFEAIIESIALSDEKTLK